MLDDLSNRERIAVYGCISLVALLIATIIIAGIAMSMHRETGTLVVTNTEVSASERSQRYMVFGELDGSAPRAFIVEDSLWYLRWDSSDMWAKLEPGSAYHVTLAGYRIPFLSLWQNIVKMEPEDAHSEGVK